MKEIGIGIVSSMFFAVTFILNRSMELDGGSWLWSASLRYFFMLPFLFAIVFARKGLKPMNEAIKKQPLPLFIWSTVGFVLFYAPLTYAAAFSPGWLVAGTWQLTILAGVLVTPLFFMTVQTTEGTRRVRKRIPLASLIITSLILIGVLLIQIPQAQTVSTKTLLLGILPIIIAAFAYPLGNRKTMEVLDGSLDTFQRILAMTLLSLPVWIMMAIIAFVTVGPPSTSQLIQTFIVGLSSGVIATTLFFMATDRARHDQGTLAAVEATQSTQLIFVIIGEMLILHIQPPTWIAIIGMVVIMIGMSLHSVHTAIGQKKTMHISTE